MTKRLPCADNRKQADLQVPKGEKKAKVENVLTKKFPHMKDFPHEQNISLF
jgi:hypothetical protein